MIKSCYIHIPFCNHICSYCDFCKLLNISEYVDKYLEALQKEIEEIYQGEELDTLYIGGGTPSCLSVSQLEKLFKILDSLKKSKNIEYTIEGNFESTTKEKLELYKKHGINRLSFGLESIDLDNLKFLDRTINLKEIEEVIKTSRGLGFSNINIDLMYALPTETNQVLEKDLDYLLSLDIEHISTYSLIIENHTVLGIHKTKSMDEDKDFEMYQLICHKLRKNGYTHYEISNFSKIGYESRHNTTYWNNDYYYGFGLGASSYIKEERIENTKSLKDYINGNYQKQKEFISKKDKIEYEVLLNLRKKEGINLSSFKQKYQQDLNSYYDYRELLEKGFLKELNQHLFIPENKWYISNEIIVRLLEREVYE